MVFFFFQAEDGIRDDLVTGVQTCALPILLVDCVILVNGKIIILNVHELSDRNLPDVPQAVAVFHQKAAVKNVCEV